MAILSSSLSMNDKHHSKNCLWKVSFMNVQTGYVYSVHLCNFQDESIHSMILQPEKKDSSVDLLEYTAFFQQNRCAIL